MKLKIAKRLWALTTLLLLTSCQQSSDYVLINGFTMGTSYQVTLQDTHQQAATIHQLVEQELKLINQQMSTYIDDSNLSVFNRNRSTDCQPLPKPLLKVIRHAIQVSQQTNGKFDVTLSPLIAEWGFDKKQTFDQVPSDEQINMLLKTVGYQKLKVTPDCVQKTHANLSVNLSAIAKGYGVDQLANILEQNNISNYLVEIGGETASKGVNPSSKAWRLAIEAPVQQRKIQQVFNPLGKGVATSGDYRNYFEKSGVRFSHTLDPTTGKPITHNLASVTVLHPQTMLADAYATAFMVMGETATLEFAQQRNLPVFLIVKSGQGFKTSFNQAFQVHIEAVQ